MIRSADQLKKELGLTPETAAKLLKVDQIDFDRTMLVCFTWLGVYEGPEHEIRRAVRFKEGGTTLEITFQRYWHTRKRTLGEFHAKKPGGALWLLDRHDGRITFKERPLEEGTGSEN